MQSVISLFSNIKETTGGKDINVDLFLDCIRNGKWQDIALPVRVALSKTTDKTERHKIKGKLPYVTISGKFSERNIKGLVTHSGLICIDIDDVDPEETKSRICIDKHVYAAYTSISGTGLAVLFKIDPARHSDAFDGLQEYLYTTYDIIVDSSCRDVSRARYVSFDPSLYINEKSTKFAHYPKKKAPTKIDKVVYAPGDFENLINEIVNRGLNICESYPIWLRCGFALAEKFSEEGREYYHAISQFSAKYSRASTDKQYTYCVRAKNTGITISTLYYYIKLAGIPLYSKQTQIIASAASTAQIGGRTKADTIKNLEQFEGIPASESTDIVNQVFDNHIVIDTDDSMVGAVEQWLKHNYVLRRNSITRYIESNGKPLQQKDFNTIYVTAKKIFEKLDYPLLDKIINSDFTPTYNPLHEYFRDNVAVDNPGAIGDLWNTIKTDNPDYLRKFGTKWLVGVIASAFGEHSRLLLVFVSEKQNIGKTEFFRRLFPKELQPYYAESKLDAGKDDDILMTQKLVIMDDEMGGKSKKDEKRLKELLSKQVFTLREPYGRNNVDLDRLAVLCGTANDKKLINDPTGNTRLLPVTTDGFDHATYNTIDKTEVIMAAYHLYKAGYNWRLTKQDIAELALNTEDNISYTNEYELISKYFRPAPPERFKFAEQMTATDVKVELDRLTGLKLSPNRIGQELQSLGFKPHSVRVEGVPKKSVYYVEKLTPGDKLNNPAPVNYTEPDRKEGEDDVPF